MKKLQEPQTPLLEGQRHLAAHASDCDACRSEPLPLEHLAARLSTSAVDIDSTLLSRRVLARLQPELERRAFAASWPRMLRGLLLALLPLPLVVAFDAYFLDLVYGLVSALLPAAFAAYLVVSYGALLVLLFALTYSAIPLLMMRSGRPLPTIASQPSTVS